MADQNPSYIGDKKVWYDSSGRISYIGDERVHYSSDGVMSYVGNDRVQIGSSGGSSGSLSGGEALIGLILLLAPVVISLGIVGLIISPVAAPLLLLFIAKRARENEKVETYRKIAPWIRTLGVLLAIVVGPLSLWLGGVVFFSTLEQASMTMSLFETLTALPKAVVLGSVAIFSPLTLGMAPTLALYLDSQIELATFAKDSAKLQRFARFKTYLRLMVALALLIPLLLLLGTMVVNLLFMHN